MSPTGSPHDRIAHLDVWDIHQSLCDLDPDGPIEDRLLRSWIIEHLSQRVDGVSEALTAWADEPDSDRTVEDVIADALAESER